MSTEATPALPLTSIEEYSKTAAALADLCQRYGKVVFDVTTTKGMDLARKGRAEIRCYRTALESKRVEIKAPALERCRLIDAEAKRIAAELVALEGPIDELIKAEEQRKANEKAEKERIERERVSAIHERIAAFGSYAAEMVGRTTSGILTAIEASDVEWPIDDSFGEFKPQAQAAKDAAIAKLRELYDAAIEQEAEQARIKAERAELAKLKTEQAQREAEERARVEAERKQLEADERATRKRIEAEEREARARILEQQRKADKERAEADRIARERREAEEKQTRQRQAEEDARLKAERDRIEAERREMEAKARAAREAEEAREREQRRQEAELLDGMQMLQMFVERYSQREEFKAVVKGISGWLAKQKQPA